MAGCWCSVSSAMCYLSAWATVTDESSVLLFSHCRVAIG
jgi:hypothetical protein